MNMKFEELRFRLAKYPVFTTQDVRKWFPEEHSGTLKVQLSLWVKKGYLKKIRRDLFWFIEKPLQDNFFLAEKLIHNSYISLETALNYYSTIPDIPFSVTCVTPLTPRTFDTPFGRFSFRHMKQEYIFGWKTVESADRTFHYRIATPEKALVDFIYFNLPRFSRIQDFTEERFAFDTHFRWRRAEDIARMFRLPRLSACVKQIHNFYEHIND